MKDDSLFCYGMKPVIFSERRKDLGWYRGGFNITYEKNKIQREGNSSKFYYTLSFTYKFSYSNDTVYFAHSYPYTYSNLMQYLNKLMNDEKRAIFIKRKVLCTTLAKNQCDILTITSNLDIVNKNDDIFLK
jgi:hypothetical protein